MRENTDQNMKKNRIFKFGEKNYLRPHKGVTFVSYNNKFREKDINKV